MRTATAAASRTAQGCAQSLNCGLRTAFRSGAVMGLTATGFSLLDLCTWYWVLDRLLFTPARMAEGWSLFGLEVVPVGCTSSPAKQHSFRTETGFKRQRMARRKSQPFGEKIRHRLRFHPDRGNDDGPALYPAVCEAVSLP